MEYDEKGFFQKQAKLNIVDSSIENPTPPKFQIAFRYFNQQKETSEIMKVDDMLSHKLR